MFSTLVYATLAIAAVSVPAEAIVSSTIHYGPNNRYTGYLARPSGTGKHPALVVIHEWWGLNDNIRREASRLAESGYVALAVDLFGKSTTDPQEAMKLVNGLDQKAATTELLASAAYLRGQKFVQADKVGSIGWCFGGGQSLNLALNDPKLKAAVIYYGKPVTDPQALKKVHAAVLGIFGKEDQSIPVAQVEAMHKAMTADKIKNEFYIYPGAGHAFANPSGGERYKPEAAKDAWAKTTAFLNRYLKR